MSGSPDRFSSAIYQYCDVGSTTDYSVPPSITLSNGLNNAVDIEAIFYSARHGQSSVANSFISAVGSGNMYGIGASGTPGM